MNQKFRYHLQHTGISLKERLPNNPREGYTCVHQDTAQLRDRQRLLHHRLQQAYRRDDARLCDGAPC